MLKEPAKDFTDEFKSSVKREVDKHLERIKATTTGVLGQIQSSAETLLASARTDSAKALERMIYGRSSAIFPVGYVDSLGTGPEDIPVGLCVTPFKTAAFFAKLNYLTMLCKFRYDRGSARFKLPVKGNESINSAEPMRAIWTPPQGVELWMTLSNDMVTRLSLLMPSGALGILPCINVHGHGTLCTGIARSGRQFTLEEFGLTLKDIVMSEWHDDTRPCTHEIMDRIFSWDKRMNQLQVTTTTMEETARNLCASERTLNEVPLKLASETLKEHVKQQLNGQTSTVLKGFVL